MAVNQKLVIGGITDSAGVDILAWSWGMSGADARSAFVEDISFTKFVDTTSPLLQVFCLSGQQTKGATLTASSPDRSQLQITMSDPVLVTSVSTGGSSGEDGLTENFTLKFGQVQVEFRDARGRTEQYGWNVLRNSRV